MMARFFWFASPLTLAACVTVISTGCRLPNRERVSTEQSSPLPIAPVASEQQYENRDFMQQVAWQQPTQEQVGLKEPDLQAAAELSLPDLVDEVLAINPSIESAMAAWRAAAQRYPQEVALDDPMFGVMLGPGSFGSDAVDTAYMLEGSQKLPWPGKRQLRGRIAQAEATANFHEAGEAQLRIAEATKLAFYEYYLANENLALNTRNLRLVEEFRDIAKTRYESGAVQQQDLLLADVELAELQRRQLELRRMNRVAIARINTLLRLTPDSPLPPPPSKLEEAPLPPSAEELRSLALAQRPELAAQNARIRAERASVALACKEFYPDFEVVARYDAFWQEEPLRPMVGFNMNIPIQKNRRWAAVREARWRLAQQEAELGARTDQLQYEVQAAYEQVIESREVIQLYEQTILPAAELSLESARAGYVAGNIDFLRLVEAQRQLIALQERDYEAITGYYRRLAELERIVGTDVQ